MVRIRSRQISNAFSTGSGGANFEAHIQTLFVVLMMTRGFVPAMPLWPIKKIKLQGKRIGYDTDDLIIFVENPANNQQCKMLVQVKRAIKITDSHQIFGEVILSAWNDFNNPTVFVRDFDVIALMTGPLSNTDIDNVRPLLERSKSAENQEEFFKDTELANFSSDGQREKLKVFRKHLKQANNGVDVSDQDVFEFLKHFHLLGYDLDIKAGVILSLTHSLIRQHSDIAADYLWTKIKDEVQSANQNAGTLTPDSVSDELKLAFKNKIVEVIPTDFVNATEVVVVQNWNNLSYVEELAWANIIGEWNDKNSQDIEAISALAGMEYTQWITKSRQILQELQSPITLSNGIWRVTKRNELWQALGTRLFDTHLNNFKQLAISVLSELNPKFELPADDRFAANIYGKSLKYSESLRKGIAETLALLANQSEALTNCTQHRPESISILVLREVFENADWVLWGSLNNLLPVLAEAAPNEFLDIVEKALIQNPCPFDILFAQEGKGGLGGSNYLTGLLWALEGLAWDEQFLVRITLLLGELASHDPGGNWGNRPANSLATIFLPWLPQTIASIEKRKAALETLCKELPEVGFKLLLALIPSSHSTSSGSHKPVWRNAIPADWEKGVTNDEYWRQSLFYSDLAIDMAGNSLERLSKLVSRLHDLPAPCFEKLLEHLSSTEIINLPEKERLDIWLELTKFVARHKRHANAKWALSIDIITKIENVSQALAPANPSTKHIRLFKHSTYDLFEENTGWEAQQTKLKELRKEAIVEILSFGGIKAVMAFSEQIEAISSLGTTLAETEQVQIDDTQLRDLISSTDRRQMEFISGYILGKFYSKGWEWFDGLALTDWTKTQIAQLLAYMPFNAEAWVRATQLLGDEEKQYWKKTNASPYWEDKQLQVAVDKLIEHGRPHAAINCISRMLHEEQPLHINLTVKALMTAVSSDEPSPANEVFSVLDIIKRLQSSNEISEDDMFKIEWAYLPILNEHNGGKPIFLERRLATNPDFFCEIISLIYRSKKLESPNIEPTELEKAIATNAYKLIHDWKTPPGLQPDGTFNAEQLKNWVATVKQSCEESGRLEVALQHIGGVFYFAPVDTDGLWIDRAVADVLNAKDAEEMRSGFSMKIHNSRGAHWVDPTGAPERELAEKYRSQANDIENVGYARLAITLRNIAESYDRQSERVINDYKHDD